MRDVNEIWIINPDGITLFNQSKGEEAEANLMGGFFSALQSFTEELGEQQLKSIVLGNSKFTIYQCKGGYLFISRSHNKVSEKVVEKKLKLIESKFFEKYENYLDKWDKNTDCFKDFGKIIENLFDDTVEKRAKQSIW